MTEMDKKFEVECKLCPIEYKCTKRKYDCPFFMEGFYVKDFDPMAED